MKKSDVTSIIDLMNRNDRMCQGSAQQVANGFYRLYDILSLIAGTLDEEGAYKHQISSITSTLNSNERFCQSAPQQIANGAYRVAEMAQVLANVIAPEQAAQVSNLIAGMNRMNAMCQGAPQQSANGTSTLSEIVEILVKKLDTEKKYSTTLSSIVMLKTRNNALCQGADQQSANYLYRTMEMIQLITNIMLDKMQKRIELYWQEHAEEKKALLAEKEENQAQIRAIEVEANRINDEGTIAPINQEISALQNKMNNCGRAELEPLQQAVRRCQDERAALGFFQFKLKKEADAKIAEAQSVLAAKQREVDKEKSVIRNQIDQKKKQIDNINKQVTAKKNTVLAGCEPHKARIAAIDFELTRQR